MHLWNQSAIGRWLRAAMVLAAVWMPTTNHVWADEGQVSFAVNDDASSLPALLLESHSEAFPLPQFQQYMSETRPIAISALPYTIMQSGKYYLDSDLELTDRAALGAAITVMADDVDLDLGDHSITVSPTIAAIFIHYASNVSVYNGRLVTPTVSNDANSVGILTHHVAHAVFDNIVFLNTMRGAYTQTSQDLTFINCRFTHPYAEIWGGAVGIAAGHGTQGLSVEACLFDLIGSCGILLHSNEMGAAAETTLAQIRNCQFRDMGSAIYLASRKDALPISNVEISDCEFNYIDCTVG
ncbi:MAG: right-handed parallel beta-helix repeat-containing protein, partial [Verrucomicrobia bacterium]|nr:right-handed parallel beta-helix repeat-containing protein [Verrucomicrobiota bacterium]